MIQSISIRKTSLEANFQLQSKNFVKNVFKLLYVYLFCFRHWREWRIGRLRDPVTREDWLDNSIFRYIALVNALYSGSTNAISFPAGILRGSFYENGAPTFMNYAGIGAVIGHEISHGFDDQGRQTDHEGK